MGFSFSLTGGERTGCIVAAEMLSVCKKRICVAINLVVVGWQSRLNNNVVLATNLRCGMVDGQVLQPIRSPYREMQNCIQTTLYTFPMPSV